MGSHVLNEQDAIALGELHRIIRIHEDSSVRNEAEAKDNSLNETQRAFLRGLAAGQRLVIASIRDALR